MRRIIDLTYPIEDHFRWKVQRELASGFARGDQFQVTRLGLATHGFTHIDAPSHILPGGSTTSDFRLECLVGEAAIIDLSGIADNAAISAGMVSRAGGHVQTGDVVIFKTLWDERFALTSREFWTQAPYLTREACEWLMLQKPGAVGFDFPQDRPTRDFVDGKTAPLAEFVSHDVILRSGTPLIEYLCNLGAVKQPRVEVCALPLNIPKADGAPIRVIVTER